MRRTKFSNPHKVKIPGTTNDVRIAQQEPISKSTVTVAVLCLSLKMFPVRNNVQSDGDLLINMTTTNMCLLELSLFQRRKILEKVHETQFKDVRLMCQDFAADE